MIARRQYLDNKIENVVKFAILIIKYSDQDNPSRKTLFNASL